MEKKFRHGGALLAIGLFLVLLAAGVAALADGMEDASRQLAKAAVLGMEIQLKGLLILVFLIVPFLNLTFGPLARFFQ